MKCPKCDGELREGKAYIGGGATTFFVGGGISSTGSLAFKAAEWQEHVILEASEVLPAHYCDGCGTVTIETTRSGLSSR